MRRDSGVSRAGVEDIEYGELWEESGTRVAPQLVLRQVLLNDNWTPARLLPDCLLRPQHYSEGTHGLKQQPVAPLPPPQQEVEGRKHRPLVLATPCTVCVLGVFFLSVGTSAVSVAASFILSAIPVQLLRGVARVIPSSAEWQ